MPEFTSSSGAPRARTAAWLAHRERGSGALLRFFSAASRFLGRPASRVVLRGITAYFLTFSPRARRESQCYLRLVLQREPTLADQWRHFFCFATAIHDRVWLAHGELAPFRIDVEGAELLDDAVANGTGALLLGAHIGSFEVVNAIGLAHGVDVAMAMYEENARKLRAMLDALQPRLRPRVIGLGRTSAMLQIRDELERGTFVGMLADRTLGDEPVHHVSLLGAPAGLPTGPLRAAALLRRRVLFMAGLHLGGNHYRVLIAPLADFGTLLPGGRSAAIAAAVERYAALLEQCCRSAPSNWFNFYRFWK